MKRKVDGFEKKKRKRKKKLRNFVLKKKVNYGKERRKSVDY